MNPTPRRLYHGCVTTELPGGRRFNHHLLNLYQSEDEARGGMVRTVIEAHPGTPIVAVVCYQVPDEFVVAAAEELGCVQVY